MLRRYVSGAGTDAPLVWYEGAGTSDRRFLHQDERGSIVAVTDATGAVLNVNSYDEYGIPRSTNVGRFQYTGQAWLPELGMYYYKARIYSPSLGRFLQPDPIGYGDGPNIYAYVHADPVNATDPSGLVESVEVSGITVIKDMPSVVGNAASLAGFEGSPFFAMSGGVAPAHPADPKPTHKPPSSTKCLLAAGKNNGLSLGLDAAGWLLQIFAGEAEAVATIGGSLLGAIDIGNGVAHGDGVAIGLGYAGKQSAAAGGIFREGSTGAKIAGRVGFWTLLAASAYDLSQVYADYKKCMAGKSE